MTSPLANAIGADIGCVTLDGAQGGTRAAGGSCAPSRFGKKRKKLGRSEFQKLRIKLALSVQACAELCGVTTRTIQNWDTKGAPTIAMTLLHLYNRRDLGGNGPEWQGWCFSRGKLIHARKKLSFTPRHLMQAHYYAGIYSRLEIARVRWQDGLPPPQVLGILFSHPGFDAIPVLEPPFELKAD